MLQRAVCSARAVTSFITLKNCMTSFTGQLTTLSNAASDNSAVLYRKVEIGSTKLRNVVIGVGLDRYLKLALGKNCTLHMNRRFIIGIDLDGASYVLDAPTNSALGLTIFASFFVIIFGLLTLLNFADGLLGRRFDGGSVMAGFFFLLLFFFASRSAVRNYLTRSRLLALTRRLNVIKVDPTV